MSSIVSIHDDRDNLAGTGVLVTHTLILTCAHVVNIALGRSGTESQDRPKADSVVTIRFNGAPGRSSKALIHSAPDAWSGPPAQRAAGADLCVVQLTEEPPAGATPARIRIQQFTSDFRALASGYPDDWNNAASSPQIDIGPCNVLGQAGFFWLVRASDGSRLAATITKSRSAGLIYSGFSGGPLERDGYLVGLLARAREEMVAASAYAIPAGYFPQCVLQSANVVSDPLAATEVRTAATTEASRAAEAEMSLGTHANEKLRQLDQAPPHVDATDELLSSYSAIFVGRSREAARIRSFVWTEQPGYLFVKGEAGAGKSALLVHLIQALRAGTGRLSSPFLIYHFIRQEQGDLRRVLLSLNAQLARALGESGSFVAAPNLEDQFKSLWSRLMLHSSRERPVFLVVDGLDELEEPDSLGRWFPGHLAPYTHVVASGRATFDPLWYLPHHHVARSAGPPIELEPLDRKDVEQLLNEQLKDPDAAARLVDPVFLLTKGFALTTRLIAKDIAENGEDALRDKARLTALMRDYLGEEARHLTEGDGDPLRRHVLAVLTEARGPMAPEDLSGILRADRVEVEQALQPILRCLASPTSLEFMHLELKKAVAERLTREERDAAHAALSSWMQSAAEARSAPLPTYVLDHFVDQFRTTGDLKTLTSTIVSGFWFASRYAQRGSQLDYINDLDRIRDRAVNSGPDWPVLCQASYVRAQLQTVAARIPSPVLFLMADLGRIDEAVEYAMLQSKLISRAWVLTRLSPLYRQGGEMDKAAETLARAEAALEQIVSPKERCSVLEILTLSFKNAGDLPSAKRMAMYCRDTVPLVNGPYQYQRQEAVQEAINASAAVGDFEEAIELVQAQANDFVYSKCLKLVVVPLVQGNAFERLLDCISKSEITWEVKLAVSSAVQTLASAGFVTEAKQLAGLVSDFSQNPLVNICEALARKGDIEGCLSTLGEIGLRSRSELLSDLTDFGKLLCRWNIVADWILRNKKHGRYKLMADFERGEALKKIVLHLPNKVAAAEAPSLARRLTTLVAIEPGISSIKSRAELVDWLADCGAIDAALAIARELRGEAAVIDYPPTQRTAREIASRALGKAGKWDEAYELLEPLLAGTDTDEADQSDGADGTRLEAVDALAQCKKHDEALALCEQIKNACIRAYGLAKIAVELDRTDAVRSKEITTAAFDLVRLHHVDKERESTYKAIAFAFAGQGFAEEARAAAALLDASVQNNVLSTIVYLLLEAGNIDDAETTARSISDSSVQRQELLRVMRHLLKSHQYERAFETANKHSYEGNRFDALIEWMEVVLAERPPYERNRWVEKALTIAKRDSSASGLGFRGRLGRAVMKIGDRDRAEAILTDTLSLALGELGNIGWVHVSLARACVDCRPEVARSIALRRLTDKSLIESAALILTKLGDWDQVALKIGEVTGAVRIRLLAAVGDTAIERGANGRAREYLKQLHDYLDSVPEAERPAGLTKAARLHLLLGDRDDAADLCRRAHEQMVQLGDAAKLESLAVPIARAGLKDLALQCLTEPDEWRRRWVQADIARGLAEAGLSDSAVELAQATLASAGGDDDWIRAECSEALAKGGRPDLALQVALQLNKPHYRGPALVKLVSIHIEAGRAQQAEEVLSLVLAADPASDNALSAQTRAEAAAMLLRLGNRERATSELVAAFAHAVMAGTDAFLASVNAGAPVLAAALPDGGVWTLVDGLELAATVLRTPMQVGDAQCQLANVQ
jgi:hypothetical protein